MTDTVLILGASGRFGRNAAQAFAAAGWEVRRFDRTQDDLQQAAQGAAVIVNAWNPLYPDWAAQVPGLHARVIAAARAADATVILPGNVYVYGSENEPLWSTTTPHLADNPLGRIRIDMERAYRDSGVRTILLRAGDYIDTSASGNWFDMILTKHLHRGLFRYPGRADIAHAWAYLPDLARAAVLLADMRADLNRFEEVNFAGYTMSGEAMAETLSRITGRRLRLRAMNWLPLRLLAPVWSMARCLVEMRYLWDTPHALDGSRFDALLPGFVPTPPEEALRRAVAHQSPEASPSVLATTSTQTSR